MKLKLQAILFSVACTLSMVFGLTALYSGGIKPSLVFYQVSLASLPPGAPPASHPKQATTTPQSSPTPEIRNQTPIAPAVSTAVSHSDSTPAANLPVFEGVSDGTSGGNAQGPKLLRAAQPEYPKLAWEESMTGQVRVKITVNEVGEIITIEVVHGNDRRGFLSAVTAALKHWKFVPMKKGGKPTGFIVYKTFEFVLN